MELQVWSFSLMLKLVTNKRLSTDVTCLEFDG